MAWDPLGILGEPSGTGSFLGGLLLGPLGWLFPGGGGSSGSGSSGSGESGGGGGGLFTMPGGASSGGMFGSMFQIALVLGLLWLGFKLGKKLLKSV